METIEIEKMDVVELYNVQSYHDSFKWIYVVKEEDYTEFLTKLVFPENYIKLMSYNQFIQDKDFFLHNISPAYNATIISEGESEFTLRVLGFIKNYSLTISNYNIDKLKIVLSNKKIKL